MSSLRLPQPPSLRVIRPLDPVKRRDVQGCEPSEKNALLGLTLDYSPGFTLAIVVKNEASCAASGVERRNRTCIEEVILTYSITTSTVFWFHELFKPIIASYMQDVMHGMPSGMEGGRGEIEVDLRSRRNTMDRRLQQAFIVIGLVVGLVLVGPPLALSQITWVWMGVDGMR